MASWQCFNRSRVSNTNRGNINLFLHTDSDWCWGRYWKLFPRSLENIARRRRWTVIFPKLKGSQQQPTLIWRPRQEEPREYLHTPYISRNYSHCPTFLPLIVWVYLHSNLCCGLQKTHLFCNRVRFGCSRSFKVVPIESAYQASC